MQVTFVHAFQKWLQYLQCPLLHASVPSVAARLPWTDEFQLRPGLSLQQVEAFEPCACPPRTLEDVLTRQKRLLHGTRLRHYWTVPAVLLQTLQERTLDC
jgi:hypothetical protein